MLITAFIFSNKPLPRIARHLLFWLFYYFRFVLLALPDVQIKTLIDQRIYSMALHYAMTYLPIYLFAVYVTLYFILPRYFSKKNISFLVLSGISLVIVTILSGYFFSITELKKSGELYSQINMITALYRCISNLVVITSAAVIVKIMKELFLKRRENEVLAVKNARNKVQLLKTQLHPRILFECLHNIYNDIDAGGLHAPDMILKLSELLSYLLYEGDMKQVALTKEIKLIQTYLELKKLEYKNNIDTDLEISGETDTFYIIPVLLLPLLEIAVTPFNKLEKMLSVFLELRTVKSKFYFNLTTNMPGNQHINNRAMQAVIDSTRERLEISGLFKFKLEFQSASDSFSIMLWLEPGKFNSREKRNIQNEANLVYEHI